jgi:hypothetical protein
LPPAAPRPRGATLSRTQMRLLLWVPLVGFWLVMLIISRSPEEGAPRDWASLAVMCVVGAAVYVPLWYALMRATQAGAVRTDGVSPPVSRAAAVYGGRRVDGSGEADVPRDDDAP